MFCRVMVEDTPMTIWMNMETTTFKNIEWVVKLMGIENKYYLEYGDGTNV